MQCSIKNAKVWSTGNKLTYSLCVFLMMMAITFTFASMYQIQEVFEVQSVQLCRYVIYGCFKVDGVLMINNKVFGIILGILVGFFSALIYFFFLLPQLLRMKGDLRISFALFSKKDRRGSGLAEVDDEKMTDSMEMAAENVKNHTLKEELEEDESREVTLYLYTVTTQYL